MDQVKALLLQAHLGVFSFVVLGGKSHGQQVFVRAFLQAWYTARRACTADFAHYTDASFEENVLGEVGIVHDGRKAVDFDVVQAVWTEVLRMRRESSTPEHFVDSLCTGFYSDELGWQPSNVSTLAVPEVTEVSMDELDPEILHAFQAQSVARRHRLGA